MVRCECCGHVGPLRLLAGVAPVCADAGACLIREAARNERQRALDARRLPKFGWAI